VSTIRVTTIHDTEEASAPLIDRAVGWTVAARAWAVLAGPISVVLIAAHLTPDEQGFYYAFASIVAFQLLFDLGLGFVVAQFASHEKALNQTARLATLLRKTLQWYGVAATLTIVSLLIGGMLFFASKETVVWRGPWIALAILAGGALFITPLLALLEGCGEVANVARVRAWQLAASNVAAWSVFLAGGRLWASPAITGTSLLVGGAWLLLARRHFFIDLLRTPPTSMSWRDEVWPFQWRIALSWIASYLIVHLFIPVLFAARGPAEAGRLGMSITLVSAMFIAATAPLTTKGPLFGALVARRDFAALDARFFPTMWRSVALMLLGSVALFAGLLLLRAIGHRWSARLLDPLPFALLLGALLANTIALAEAVYLRAHKQEPFLGVYIATALVIVPATFVLGRAYGATGMMLGYFAATALVTLGGGTWVFQRKRREWHA